MFSPEKVITPADKVFSTEMVEAQDFFRSKGLEIDENGLVKLPLTEEKLLELKNWQEETIGKGGILMMTLQDFYKKVLLATSLFPQRDGDEINYLQGKGTGTEIALLGQVEGRDKKSVNFPFRSHSDFELYGVDVEKQRKIQNEKVHIYPKEFRQVFGNQEYFPLSTTKGLKEIPEDLLHETSEEVDFGGIKILVPQLELLFLDKYIASESTPREEGSDAELLARTYDLDRDKLHEYLDRFVLKPAEQKLRENIEDVTSDLTSGMQMRFQLWCLYDERMAKVSKSDQIKIFVREFNKEMAGKIKINKEFGFAGLDVLCWEPLKADQLDESGSVVDQQYIDDFKQRVKAIIDSQVESLGSQHELLDEFLQKKSAKQSVV